MRLEEQRSQFAREREEDVKRERDELRKQFRKLKAQIAAGAPKREIGRNVSQSRYGVAKFKHRQQRTCLGNYEACLCAVDGYRHGSFRHAVTKSCQHDVT
jgi:hypothetical protein